MERLLSISGLRNQKGARWIRFGTKSRSVWFSLDELHRSPTEVFSRLSTQGTTLLTPASQTKFKETIEERQTYRDALVAERPGWLGGHYVFADGTVQSPPGDETEIIVSFLPDDRFSPRGEIDEWQESIQTLCEGQPLLLFALSYAFVGPLLRFAPADYINLLAEIVGPPESGKSTVLVAAQSVWGGNPDSDIGACESWDLTAAALDEIKLNHADGFLALDEGNLAGATSSQQKEIISTVVFKAAGTGRKKRYGDIRPGPQARVAMMSTTNSSLAELVNSQGHVAGALRSRMLTILIGDDSRYGVLSSIPAGCTTSRKATELLRKSANESYGTAARQFIERLVTRVSEDEAKFHVRVDDLLTQYLESIPHGDSARISKTFALTAVAGFLACRWGVLPFASLSVVEAIQQLHRSLTESGEAQAAQSALGQIQEYIGRHEHDLAEVPMVPLMPGDFQKAFGFRLRESGREAILIPSGRFQREFPEHGRLMRELRAAGLAKTEKGKQPKLTIKCPTSICSTGRVYWIFLSPNSAGC